MIIQRKKNYSAPYYRWSNIENNINIGTLNVRGFNNLYKREEILTLFRTNNISIIGITETKLNKKRSQIIEKTQKKDNYMGYLDWYAGIEEEETKTGGVGILINKDLGKHVAEVTRFKGRLIIIKLKFKGKKDLLIINVYMNSNAQEKKKRRELIKEIERVINENEILGNRIILMGDLNADREKWEAMDCNTTKDKYHILRMIKNFNLYDTQKISKDELAFMEKTWIKNVNTSRRLDYIWISENLLDELIQTEVENSLNLESDHKLVKMTIRKEICERLNQNNSKEKRNNYTRTVFNTKNMNSKDWKNFVQVMDIRISFSQVKAELEHFKNQNSTDYQNTINRIWDEIENIILNSMRATIPQITINKTDRKYIKKQKSKTRTLNNMIRKVLELIRQNKLYTYGLDKKVKLIKLFEEIERDNIGLFTGLVNLKENLLTNNYVWLTKNLTNWAINSD